MTLVKDAFMHNFSPLSSKLSEEFEVTDGSTSFFPADFFHLKFVRAINLSNFYNSPLALLISENIFDQLFTGKTCLGHLFTQKLTTSNEILSEKYLNPIIKDQNPLETSKPSALYFLYSLYKVPTMKIFIPKLSKVQ